MTGYAVLLLRAGVGFRVIYVIGIMTLEAEGPARLLQERSIL